MKKICFLLLLVCFCTLNAQTPAKRDRKFAYAAAEASMMEVKLGLLSLANTTTSAVVTGGTETAKYHSRVVDTLQLLARKKNIVLPLALGEKKQSTYDKLSYLVERKFDKKYVGYMIILHEKYIRLFNKEAKSGRDAELKSWAAAQALVLKEHLLAWKEVRKLIKG